MGLSGSQRKFVWIALLYVASGLPYGLLNEAVPVAFRQGGVDLAKIGLLSLVGLPWTLKFLWAPAVDRISTRRNWILASLTGLALCFFAFSSQPANAVTPLVWTILVLAAIASATQDIAIDAYSIEVLDEKEIGPANGVRVTAYRVAMILGGGALVGVSAWLGWGGVWLLAAGIFLLLGGLLFLLPPAPRHPVDGNPIVAPLRSFLRRPGVLGVAVFILTFKLGDVAMAPMTKPFWVDAKISAPEIGLLATVGIFATILGAMLGGILTGRWGTFRALWILGFFQAISNLGYAGAALAPGRATLWSAALFENFCTGLGTAAFLAFLMASCEKRYAATQYALLSALFGLTRSVAGAFSGYVTKEIGYANYFAATFVVALPAFFLLPFVRRWLEARATE